MKIVTDEVGTRVQIDVGEEAPIEVPLPTEDRLNRMGDAAMSLVIVLSILAEQAVAQTSALQSILAELRKSAGPGPSTKRAGAL